VGAIILLICSVLTLVGVFLPWINISMSYEGFYVSISVSGWDLVSELSFMDWMMAGSIDPYLVVGGAIAMVVGTLGAIIVSRTSDDPGGALKVFGGAIIIGAIVAIIGAVWFMIDMTGDSLLSMMGINVGIGYGLFISLIAAIGGIIAAVAPMIMESRGVTLSDSSYISPHGPTDPGVLSPREIAEMKARGPAGLDAAMGGGYPQQQPAMGPSGPMEPTGAAGPIGPMASMGAMGAAGAGVKPTGTATEHFNRASDLEAMGEHDKAMIEYSKAIAADENHAMSYFNRGSLYMQANKVADAITDFEKVIQRSDNPDLQRMAQLRIEEINR